MRALKQALRGCGTLPYVGEHPGTPCLVLMLIAGALAGGWLGIAIMSAICLPLYLHGGYERAEMSDRELRRMERKSQ